MHRIMHQFERFNKIIIVGQGKVRAYKFLDSRIKIPLGCLPDDVFLGDIQVLFQTDATHAVETVTYCSMGIVDESDF